MKNAAFWWAWGVVSWVLYLSLVAIPMWVLGIPVCLYLSLTRQYEFRKSRLWPYDILAWTPKWAYPWGNEEDGVDGARGGQKWLDDTFQMAWWFEKTAGWPDWLVAFWWTAIRNPMCNMRFTKPFGYTPNHWQEFNIDHLGPALDPREDGWFFARRGWYTALYFKVFGLRFRIGWNIYPQDAYDGVRDYRAKGIGFKLQLQHD